MTITITWGDGYISVSPAYPERLLKALTYWHRSIAWDPAQRKRVATGESRALYQIKPYIDSNQQPANELLTMPGFLHKIKMVLDAEGYNYRIEDRRTPAPKPDIAKALVSLREYQYESAITTLMSGGGIISAPTGFGKTWLMSALIKAYDSAELKTRGTPLIVVTTPDKDITRKNYNDLVGMLPDRDVGLVMSGSSKYSDDIQVITLDSLHHIDPDDVGLLIVDECHTAATDGRTDVILALRKAIKYGVSATPSGRFDGRDLVTEGMLGPVVHTTTYQQGVKCGALVPIKVYWLNAPHPDCGLDDYLKYQRREAMYRVAVDRNTANNTMIANLIDRTPSKMQLLCIMPHLDQMNKLAGLTKTKCVHAEESQESLTERKLVNLTAVNRKERIATYNEMFSGELRKIMATYVYKQGVNFPELQVIINAGGGGSDIVAKQIPGRESRNIDNKFESYLVDFWHPWDVTTDERGKVKPGPIQKDDRSRRDAYEELGFEQTWLDKLEDLPFLREGDNAQR